MIVIILKITNDDVIFEISIKNNWNINFNFNEHVEFENKQIHEKWLISKNKKKC